MTITALINEAASLGPWRLTPEGFIRTSKTRWCPLIAVARKRGWSYGMGQELRAAKTLGLTRVPAIVRFVHAADSTMQTDARTALLRRQMLKAFGLREAAR
jgi:hypothetical protein